MKAILDNNRVLESEIKDLLICKSLAFDSKSFSSIPNTSFKHQERVFKHQERVFKQERRAHWVQCHFLTLSKSEPRRLEIKGEETQTVTERVP